MRCATKLSCPEVHRRCDQDPSSRTVERPRSPETALVSALERRDVAFNAVWNRLLPILERVSVHISEYSAKGELRKNDPLITARLILAAALFHCEMYELYGAKRSWIQSERSQCLYADILYCGLRP